MDDKTWTANQIKYDFISITNVENVQLQHASLEKI